MNSGLLIGAIIYLVICGGIGLSLAYEIGRREAGFFLGLLFGPIGIIMALLLPPRRSGKQKAIVDSETAADFAALTASQGKTGLSFSLADGRTVQAVDPGSAADGAGILPGDRLLLIDGQLCEGDYWATLSRIVGEPGTSVCLAVRRGKQRLDFDLRRA